MSPRDGRLGLLVAVLLVVGLSACTRSPPPGANGDQLSRITFGEISAAPSHTPLYVAIGEGFFKQQGLDVTLQTLSGGTPTAMAAMATGSVDMMMAGAPEFIEYSARKVIAGKIVGELQDSTFDIVVAKGITDLQQLKGKVVGISGANGGDQIYFQAVMHHYGLADSDVTFLTSGNSTNRLTALSTGAVQATAVSNSTRDISERLGTVLLKSTDSPVRIPSSMIFASAPLLATQRPAVQNFFKALGAATDWVRAHHDQAATYCAKGSGATHEACLSAIQALADHTVSGRFTWSESYAIDTTATADALAAEASQLPEARAMKLDDIVDTSLTGSTP
jgi:NitT/TauT family transport system substrate-binding protein